MAAAANKERDDAEAKAIEIGVEGRSRSADLNAIKRKLPKPRASEMSDGNDRLRRSMGLEADKVMYLAIQVSRMQPSAR